jgi:hypothetical protein
MSSDGTFRVYAPLSFFEKSDAAEGQKKRIAGVISTEMKDKQDEVVVQKGLDFGPFVGEGWFNDNHSRKTADVLGYPTGVQRFQKGERLPDGTIAKSNCTWAEGYLLDTPEAGRIWELGRALSKAGSTRRLGFSIEGGVKRREGFDGKVVAKAIVRNVAITNCPVGEGTRLETLAKALTSAPPEGDPPPAPGSIGSKTGEGAGYLLSHRSVEGVLKPDEPADPQAEELTKSEAIYLIRERLGCDEETGTRVYETFASMKARGEL